jgi:single-stranded-DNA-specific exonuclease
LASSKRAEAAVLGAAEWVPAPVPESAAALVAAGWPAWQAALLARRDVRDAEAARAFLNPDASQLHAPQLLFGMPEAIERLLRARAGAERVAVVGDYDADGVTSTALLVALLRACGLTTEPVLPHRLREGYGFQPLHVERARELGCTLIVTVDCGTTAFAGAESARAAGIDLIVTDHHLPAGALPEGVLLVNPRQPGCEYPFRDLAGVGLALKLGQAFAARCGKEVSLAALLRIACLGTVADMVPLRGENRVIAALGLRALGETRSLGLRALLERARIREPISADDIGFRIGPRLNAAGRLGSALEALELLLTRDPRRAAELADLLEAANRKRQAEEARVVDEARALCAPDGIDLPPILVGWSEAWHPGVVGIAAGRLAREYRRPTLLLAVREGVATGSGRSVPQVHLHDFLQSWSGDLLRFGGHAQAIGLSVVADRLPGLRDQWSSAAWWAGDLAAPAREYELACSAGDIDEALLAALESMAPYGQGNPQPVARVGPLQVRSTPRIFGDGHLAAIATGPDGSRVEILGWGWAAHRELLRQPFEILAHVERDRRHRTVVLRGVDLRALA